MPSQEPCRKSNASSTSGSNDPSTSVSRPWSSAEPTSTRIGPRWSPGRGQRSGEGGAEERDALGEGGGVDAPVGVHLRRELEAARHLLRPAGELLLCG